MIKIEATARKKYLHIGLRGFKIAPTAPVTGEGGNYKIWKEKTQTKIEHIRLAEDIEITRKEKKLKLKQVKTPLFKENKKNHGYKTHHKSESIFAGFFDFIWEEFKLTFGITPSQNANTKSKDHSLDIAS